MLLHPTTFYNALPKHKIELVDQKIYISGDLRYSKMVLEYILKGYGVEYIMPMIDQTVLQEACIEAYGRGENQNEKEYPTVDPTFPVAHLAGQLQMALYAKKRWGVFGRDMVVKLGNDGLTPDIYVFEKRKDPRQKHYYFDGPPELIIEVVHPAMRRFEREVRLRKYEQGRVPEVWLIDHADRKMELFRLSPDKYERTELISNAVSPMTLPDLVVYPDRLWPKDDNWWELDLYNAVETIGEARTVKKQGSLGYAKDIGWSSLPFGPEIGLTSTPVSFEQYISWAPEAKFEWIDDKPLIGGSDIGNYRLTGLLLMSLGLVEALKMLGKNAWQPFLN